jgi:hypothetical protein
MLRAYSMFSNQTKNRNGKLPESNAQVNHGDKWMLNDTAKQLGCDVQLLVWILWKEFVFLEQVLSNMWTALICRVPGMGKNYFLNQLDPPTLFQSGTVLADEDFDVILIRLP